MKGVRHKWYPDELLFLKQNINKLTNQQLLDAINAKRANPVNYSTMRHQFIRMGILRSIQIRWSKVDVKFLIKHYKNKGNTELAELLNQRKKTFRIVDGKKHYRTFTKKHVEKKLKLLQLKRTDEEVRQIKRQNNLIGRSKVFTSTDNVWTRGIRTKSKEGEVRIWKRSNGKPVRVIKVNGTFIPYARWFYHNYIAPVPNNMRVFHIDFDSINDDPDNLELRDRAGVKTSDRERAIPLLKIRLLECQKKLKDEKERLQQLEAQKEFARIKNLIKNLKNKLNHANNNSTQSNRYYTGEVS